MTDARFHEMPDGRRIAFRHSAGEGPTLVFLPGYMSDMAGGKATAIFAEAKAKGRACLLLDYSGCGESSGDFADGTLSRWREEVMALIDAYAEGTVLVTGSSMGGWIMLQLALARPARVIGLVGIASAPDFTRALAEGGLAPEQMLQLELSGFCDLANCYDDGEPYRISRELLEEGNRHCLLDDDCIAIDVPVRLLHGQCDEDVPWQRALQLAEKLRSTDVEVQLVKDGDHRLSRPVDLARLARALEVLLAQLENGHE